jgi:hypothetical protein
VSAEVIGGLPWSLPGSRIVGLIEDSSVTVYSAEYETPLANSKLLFDIQVKDWLGEFLSASNQSFGVIGFGQKLTLSFSALEEIELRNVSTEKLQLNFSTSSPNTIGSNLQMLVFLDGNKLSTVDGSYQLELEPKHEIKLVHSPLDSALPSNEIGINFSSKLWSQWMDKRPLVSSEFQRAVDTSWYCLGVNSIYLRYEPAKDKLAVVPSVLGYVGVWQWDAYFIAVGLKHGDFELAKNQLELVLGFPKDNGQLQDVIHDLGILASFSDLPEAELNSYAKAKGLDAAELSSIPITKPPLATWAVKNLAEFARKASLYEQFFDVLVKQHNWWWSTTSASANELPCYQHPFSSGLDDSPSFDDFQPATPPDLISYLLLEGKLLMEIADLLGFDLDYSLANTREQVLRSALENSWDAEHAIYKTFIETGFNESKTILTLLPLLTDLGEERISDLMGILLDPSQFGGDLSVPTVSRADSKYSTTRMWRGPVWANTNLLIIEGLEARGKKTEARELALKTLRLIAKNGGSYEYYDSATSKPAESAVACFSWTAAVCVDLAVRYASN